MDMTSIPEELSIYVQRIENIMIAINQDQSYTALNETDLLLKLLDDKFKKEHKLTKIHSNILHFLKNPTNTRILRMMQRLKTENETAIEYYDRDIGSDERLYYQEELEKDIIEIYDQIKIALAIVIQQKIGGDITL